MRIGRDESYHIFAASPRACDASPVQVKLRLEAQFLSGRALYEQVVRDTMLAARRSVWIATANVKELYVERPGLRRGYGSILGAFDELAERGVELRMIHAELPSRRFRAAFDRRPRLVSGGLQMKHCPRNHLKAVVVDGAHLYLGSANFTGAGLGAKGEDKRNFELGFLTDNFELCDRVQALFQDLWDGEPCRRCAIRAECPDPGGYGR
jgi:phosphatidylserine/phosphatidylglycerophosphate/cardiolipin synthase-like enzyme